MCRMSSKFGFRTHPTTGQKHKHHNGCDFATPIGTPIYNNVPMKILRSETNKFGFGELVVAQDNNGNKYYYAHLDNRNVKVGDQVPAGTKMGNTGNTGRSSGPHLHHEVHSPNGTKIDPTSIDPSTGKPYTDNSGFQPGQGMVDSECKIEPGYKKTPEAVVSKQKDKVTNKPVAPANKQPTGPSRRDRPRRGSVGLFENPLNKL